MVSRIESEGMRPVFRKLGNTGLDVTAIGLGLAALGRPGYINIGNAENRSGNDVDAMRNRATNVLDAAWQTGIRYFDAARSYGRAEEFLGAWLNERDIAPDQVAVGSKWGYTYTADWQIEATVHEVKDHTLSVLMRQREESAAFLGSYLRLYQIHSASESSGVLERRDVLAELARYRDEGMIIGLSLSGVDQAQTLRHAMMIAVDGLPLFTLVQVTWNLFEQSCTAVLQDAYTQGMGIIVKEVLANGRLTAANTGPKDAPALDLLRRIAKRHGVTVDAISLAAVLAQPWCHIALSGASTVAHLAANMGALKVNLSNDELVEVLALVEAPTDYWTNRSKLAWN